MRRGASASDTLDDLLRLSVIVETVLLSEDDITEAHLLGFVQEGKDHIYLRNAVRIEQAAVKAFPGGQTYLGCEQPIGTVRFHCLWH